MMRITIGLILGVLVLPGTAAAQGQTQKPAAPPAAPTQKPTAPVPAPQAPATAKPAAPAPAPVPFPPDAKVGFVDMQYVISESKLGKVGMEKIQALSTKQNSERTQRSTEIQKLQQELQAGSSVLTQAENLNKQLLAEFEAKVLPIVEQVRAERNLWLIFTADTPIAAGHPGLNLSLEVIKKLDAAP
jgi:Skp family chaperone for outer membrane proteins